MKSNFILLAILSVLQVFDVLMTKYGIDKGYAYESNPLIAAVAENFGWWAVGLIKLAGSAFFGWLIWRGLAEKFTRYSLVFMNCAMVGFTTVPHVQLYLMQGVM